MMPMKNKRVRYKRLSTEKRKEQIRQAQARLRAKRKKEGVKEQPFALSEADHENMDEIKKSVKSVKSKSAAISYALAETVKKIREGK